MIWCCFYKNYVLDPVIGQNCILIIETHSVDRLQKKMVDITEEIDNIETRIMVTAMLYAHFVFCPYIKTTL